MSGDFEDKKSKVRAAVMAAPRRRRKAPATPEDGDGYAPYPLDFPEGCPVEPLGLSNGTVWFLDVSRQLVGVPAEKLNKGTIMPLFGTRQALKYTYWPRYAKTDDGGAAEITGWRPEWAADVLYAEAARRGLWDVMDRVRGAGCWLAEDGGLMMHCGDLIYSAEGAVIPCAIGRYVYPAAAARPHPEDAKQSAAAGEELLSLIRTWSWRRPDLDPELLLGWIVAAMLGGALKWRPMVWITGDKATGKSTLHDLLKGVFGMGGIISSSDATPAGLWQAVGNASLPVALDELEAEEDNRKAQGIIKLARQASSGEKIRRGGSDHKGVEFTARSCFLFSSILIPPMLGQDVSRLAVLELDRLEATTPPALTPARLEKIGASLRARLLQHWHRFPALLHTWQAQLASLGHGGRSVDQFGTLMACADLVLFDAAPDFDTLRSWGERLKKSSLAECEGDRADHERCLSHLLTAQLDLFRSGERRTVGSWIAQAAGRDPEKTSAQDVKDANRALMNVGMKVEARRIEGYGPTVHLLHVANEHQGLARLFAESHWATRSGADGVWRQALRRIPGAEATRLRFSGARSWCTSIPLERVLGKVGDDE